MRRMSFLFSFLQVISFTILAQVPSPPSVNNNFQKLTSYTELSNYIELLGKQPGLLKVEIIGHSVKGRNLYALKFSSSVFGQDTSKIKVLIFAQQHGNEQSGKEGALLLARELLKPENRYLFNNIDFVLVPQLNPDGSEVNKRRNANGADLNRNHLILTEPETIALHRLFDRFLFEATMDVHEYSPFGGEWRKYGYRKNSDENIGTNTNLDVADGIRKLQDNDYLPFIFNYLHDRNFSSFTYCPGGPPEIDYIRHSTFDINDGRQSFGIQGTFSFIQEGMNGRDDSIENLQRRAEGQMTGMRGLLEYVYTNKVKVKTLVSGERKKLASSASGQEISIQSVHAANGQSLKIPLFSYFSQKDSLVTVKDYRPVVKSVSAVREPLGYLIPKDCAELLDWALRQSFVEIPLKRISDKKFIQYNITFIDSADFEGEKVVDPRYTINIRKNLPTDTGFIFIPTSQLKGKMLVLALEPKSMLGLATYEKYAHLLQAGKPYPVLRVEKK